MSAASPTRSLAAGYEALARGEWEAARVAFSEALEDGDYPEALDGLGRALWWLRDAEGAVVHRERAYAGFRRDGELARAVRIALWLSREYSLVWGNDAASNGWLARAERLLRDVAPGAEQGWLALARAERAVDPEEAADLAGAALEVGIRTGDADLELLALAQLGLAEIALGEIDRGLARFDEAMAAATAGEPTSFETFADVCCSLMVACERAGDDERPRQWSRIIERFADTFGHVPLLAFCRMCCADVHVATGRIDDGEQELLAAIKELSEAGQRSRCVHPAGRLAEIRVAQGRLEEASALLVGFETDPDALHALVAVRIAGGEHEAAEALLERRLGEVAPGSAAAVPMLAQLVDVRLARGALGGAAEAAAQLSELADASPRPRAEAVAALARGRVALASGGVEAEGELARAVELLGRQRLPLDAARARLDLARARAATSPAVAVDIARSALAELEALGADRDADQAAAFLRTLGARGRTGPKSDGALTKREREVLRLLGEGCSNAEIAERLFISPKTAEHHVGRILRKLDLRSRTEAATYAVLNSGRE